jgi:hypothetical protein
MDILVENHGSIVLLRPVSDAGREWLDDNISSDAQRLGDAVACEPRYVRDIADGAQNDGLVVVGQWW